MGFVVARKGTVFKLPKKITLLQRNDHSCLSFEQSVEVGRADSSVSSIYGLRRGWLARIKNLAELELNASVLKNGYELSSKLKG
jgi:hypothetical protein